MKVSGSIITRKRVRSDNEECWGTCQAYKQKFSIRISEKAFDDPMMFADTLLHEMIHLWLFMVMTRCDADISQRRHHEIINKIVPIALRKLREFLIGHVTKIPTRRK